MTRTLIIFDVDNTILYDKGEYILWRPHLNVLLKEIQSLGYDIALWTLGEACDAEKIKDTLEDRYGIRTVFWWSSSEAEKTYFNLDGTPRERLTNFKNLKRIRTTFPEYTQLFLIDDSPEHAELNKLGEVIVVKEFTGDYDEEFLRIRDLLLCTSG